MDCRTSLTPAFRLNSVLTTWLYISFISACPAISTLIFDPGTVATHITTQVRLVNLTVSNSSPRMPIQDEHPIGTSFEFYEFPAYMELENTAPCLANLEDALGSPASIRIGGTTQDFGIFEPGLEEAIKYNLLPGEKVPRKLLFGPKFIQLAATLKGPITLGFNRKLNNLKNTILAVTEAIRQIPNIYSVELGNEPEFYGKAPPIGRKRPWNPVADMESQVEWQTSICEAVNKLEFVQAGVYQQQPKWSIAHLALKEGKAARYVKSFGGHVYQQSGCHGSKDSLRNLMLHHNIAEFVKKFEPEVAAAQKLHKPYHFSETSSANCGGTNISSTFGASLWLMDYTMQSLMLGVHRLYFHFGTLHTSQYNLWGKSEVYAPFYGAYFTALALRKATHVTLLHNNFVNHPVYALYNGNNLIQLLLYNSVYYDREGHVHPRPSRPYAISGLPESASKAEALYLTAPDANTRHTSKIRPTVGGASFNDATCHLTAPLKPETITIKNGELVVLVSDSQAVLITLPDFSKVASQSKGPSSQHK